MQLRLENKVFFNFIFRQKWYHCTILSHFNSLFLFKFSNKKKKKILSLSFEISFLDISYAKTGKFSILCLQGVASSLTMPSNVRNLILKSFERIQGGIFQFDLNFFKENKALGIIECVNHDQRDVQHECVIQVSEYSD